MIIDSDGNPIHSPGSILPLRAPLSIRAIWLACCLALVVGVAAAVAFALWVALILIPLAIVVSGIASIVYRFRLTRARKSQLPRRL